MPQDGKKVLLIEINEVTWDLIDPFIAEGKLPTFARLKREGSWGSPMSVDLPPQLDPWTTVYTGRPQTEHGVYFLQQPPETIKAPRIWELLHQQGISVGVYGSVCSWPPLPVNGFHVPDTFSPDTATHPPELEAIQALNLTYTRSIRLPSDQDTLGFKMRLGMQLLKLGLSPSTMMCILTQLARERIDSKKRWQRVVLQPLANFDFFRQLYRKHRPRFASFHTNHGAHYMHTYWKAMQPDKFLPLENSADEVENYGSAIEYGYRSADDLLKNILSLVGPDTILVVASSMGQKPFTTSLKGGKVIRQLHSVDDLLRIAGFASRAKAVSMMSDQFNIYPDSPATGEELVAALKSVYVDTPDLPMFAITTVDNGITVNLVATDRVKENSRCYFPLTPGAPSHSYFELVYDSKQVKSGCHDPKGMMIIYGTGIRAGVEIGSCTNLDIAPTLFTLLGERVPSSMTGRILTEAFEQNPVKEQELVSGAL